MKKDSKFGAYAHYSGIAFQMFAIIAAGVFIGVKLDEYLGYQKLFTVVFSLVSVVLSIYFVVRIIIKNT